MSASAYIFGEDSAIFKIHNVLGLGGPGLTEKLLGTGDPKKQYAALGEISKQTAKEGDPRTIVWGRVRPVGGNLIHCQKPKRTWVESEEEVGGKAGASKTQTSWTEKVTRSYAIGVCEGPITRFVRVWRNNKLVYDARGNAWGAKNNKVFTKGFRFYLGDWDQLPDPTLEAIWGADIPAYRGTAYMVAVNEDLTAYGGAVPQWLFEVERAEGTYLTSRPYSIESVESIEMSLPGIKESPNSSLTEALDLSQLVVESGSLRDAVQVYENYAPEAIDLSQMIIEFGSLTGPTNKAYLIPPEGVQSSQITIAEGTLKNVIRRYENYAPEAVDLSQISITSGSLT